MKNRSSPIATHCMTHYAIYFIVIALFIKFGCALCHSIMCQTHQIHAIYNQIFMNKITNRKIVANANKPFFGLFNPICFPLLLSLSKNHNSTNFRENRENTENTRWVCIVHCTYGNQIHFVAFNNIPESPIQAESIHVTDKERENRSNSGQRGKKVCGIYEHTRKLIKCMLNVLSIWSLLN